MRQGSVFQRNARESRSRHLTYCRLHMQLGSLGADSLGLTGLFLREGVDNELSHLSTSAVPCRTLENPEYKDYILFTRSPWPGDSEGTFGVRVNLPPAYQTRWRLHTVSFMLNVNQGNCRYQFCSLWFNPTGNRTHICRFSCRRSLH